MIDLLRRIFSADGFMPHGHCYLWTPGIVWLHVVSDTFIALAYYSIPLTLAWFVRRRRDIDFRWMFVCFAIFILACGTTHLMEIWNVWHGNYWLSGIVKALTALASVPTAVLLTRLMPQALALPSPSALAQLNVKLEEEVQMRRRAQEDLHKLNTQLEIRVIERTAELNSANQNLQRQMAERKRAEVALRASEERLRLITNLVPHGIFAKDATGHYIFVNRALAEGCGLPVEEVLGKTDYELVMDRAQAEAYRKVDREVLETGREKFIAEEANTNNAGETRYLQTTKIPFVVPETGERAVLGVCVDVTERKRVNEQIQHLNAELEQRVAQRTDQLEAANKELEAFSYSVSHDLRAPLRAVDGFSEAVLEDCGALLTEKGQRHLQRIRAGAQRMGALIDDLLAFSRLSRQPIARRPVNMTRLVRDTIDELAPQTEGRQVELRCDELPACHGDPALLKQIWANLLSNALKYSRKRDLAKIEIGCRNEGGEQVYYVRDNGTGFDMRYVDKLFGVFQRLHRAEDYEGTGVGLAIVQRIIHRHGGRIWAEAELNRGASFSFTLGGESLS